eukprot:TRINITY_DN4884_c0_g2_i1.p1 TRINITY_DN4884_c0_g2~~TRINITY_DN4884_c0_g2_i1.p1  ORF type:complete len:143 (-),score=42.75 TRINITY_DN4884_c0_g2_i1:87-515(-)
MFGLVDYGDISDEEKQPQDEEMPQAEEIKKRSLPEESKPEPPKKKKKLDQPKDDSIKNLKLPTSFMTGTVGRGHLSTSSLPTHATVPSVPEKKEITKEVDTSSPKSKSKLIPPQLRTTRKNIVTEDYESWNRSSKATKTKTS